MSSRVGPSRNRPLRDARHIRWWETGGRTDLANGVMLCTLCHHDVHRQGWEILARAGHVDFIPPSTIDPTRRPRPVGLAAITIEDTDGTDCTDCTDGTDPPRHDTWESSVPNHGGTCGAGENSDLDQSRVDAAGDQSPWDNAA